MYAAYIDMSQVRLRLIAVWNQTDCSIHCVHGQTDQFLERA